MIFVDLNFAEFLGFFFTFACLLFITIVVLSGIMRLFDHLIYEKFWWFGFKNRRK